MTQFIFAPPQTVHQVLSQGVDAQLADVNGDGFDDIIGGRGWASLNRNASDLSFDEIFVIGGEAFGGGTLLATKDIDGDGDEDLFFGSTTPLLNEGDLSWYRNDGDGAFARVILGSDATTAATMLSTGDIDGDGDLDLVSGMSYTDVNYGQHNHLAWHENHGENGFERHIIDENPRNLRNGIQLADIDSDGDLDFATNIDWYENTDGQGTFDNQVYHFDEGKIIGEVALADIDGDGDSDFVAGYRSTADYFDTSLAWFENLDGLGTFSQERLVAKQITVSDLEVLDMDGDGDLDFVAAGIAEGKVVWYENHSGSGDFGPELIIGDGLDRSSFVEVSDLDNDGDLDVVTRTDAEILSSILLYRNEGPRIVGDSNSDGQFDSSDLVVVFQAAEYEDEIDRNSTFSEGDWNGDGDFTTSDLVHAFQFGNYIMSASAVANVGPDPSETRWHDVIFAVMVADMRDDESNPPSRS